MPKHTTRGSSAITGETVLPSFRLSLRQAIVLACYESGVLSDPAWGTGIPATVLELIFKFLPSRQHITCLDHVCVTWRNVSHRPVLRASTTWTDIKHEAEYDWLDNIDASTWVDGIGEHQRNKVRDVTVARKLTSPSSPIGCRYN